ncbi:MAG TPA: PAS domain-containing protein [Gemmatimonadaceae bacterium]|jgi:PAS domain-containing protein|nr:PAS domain-containing protein [Gemmatimonadaceae bacterium]
MIGGDDLITTFAEQRQLLLKHTADILRNDTLPATSASEEREGRLSAILVSSLEQLKVAEEELVERTEALAKMRDELEERIYGIRQLFDLAPVCLLVTDTYGSIVETNLACAQLLRRDCSELHRQPIARFIAPDERRGFRESLARVVAAEGVSDWRFLLNRPTDTALRVSAAVSMLKNAGIKIGARLLWSIRVVEGPDGGLAA